MTGSVGTKTPRRKHNTRSQEVPIILKENVSYNERQGMGKNDNVKKKVKKRSTATASKENTENLVIVNTTQNLKSPHRIRKSERQRKSTYNSNDFVYNSQKPEIRNEVTSKRNVLSDKTNSPQIKEFKCTFIKEKTTKTQKKSINVVKALNVSQSKGSQEKECDRKPHIPVYKTVPNVDHLDHSCNPTLDFTTKKEAIYDFEVDENEEPAKKKKRRKRPYIKRTRIGPKALTINNIKYSSTESLVSLPEKPVRRKKIIPKVIPSMITSSSIAPSSNNVNDLESTSCSVQSLVSQKPLSFSEGKLKKKHELSVLQETQSENCPSPVCDRSYNTTPPETMVSNHIYDNPPSSLVFQDSNQERFLPEDSASLQQRCYPSKKSLSNCSHRISQCGSNETLPNQLSHCSANVSRGSFQDFLSSTPCKKMSLVICHNSVFSDSYEVDIPDKFRPSTGFVKTPLHNIAADDKCFGFDEPEELEEPLVSPIKNINLPESKILPRRHYGLLEYHKETDHPKLDPKEVIERLKATIPKTKAKEITDVYNSDSSRNHSNTSSPTSKEVETTLTFTKPPRRSYERQRRVRYCSEHEEEDDTEEENEIQQGLKEDETQEKESVPKPSKKFYQKRNISKVFKAPQIPKAKQKILKEEEEMEKLAAQLNAQFQEIDKCNLVVE